MRDQRFTATTTRGTAGISPYTTRPASAQQIDRWIATEERREIERRHGEQARPPAPDWLIEMGLDGRDPVYVHVGGCHMAGKRSRGVDRDQALRAVTEGVPACTHCRPDTELGLLDRRSPPGWKRGRTPDGALCNPGATELAAACVARPFG
ncbi:DUF6233 domain-containing protein [Streptomyces sp. NPDC005356]|uniref:DUF6233 domain-containing protein n=1 Tax=Streptomyces sp. NPDC005356 TaxID=3157167 RepID=UPI0033AABD54